MARKGEPRIEAFRLRIDEVKLLSLYRKLPPHDRESMISATERYLTDMSPKRSTAKPGENDHRGSAG